MDSASDSPAPANRGSFVKGFFSGAFNSALVATLLNGTLLAAGLIGGGIPLTLAGIGAFIAAPAIGWSMMGAMATALGLFGGIMAVRRGGEEAAAARKVSRDIVRDAEDLTAARTQTLAASQTQNMDQVDPGLVAKGDKSRDDEDAPESADQITADAVSTRRNWANRTQRNLQSNMRWQLIADQGRQTVGEHKEGRVAALMRQREEAEIAPESTQSQR